MLGGVKWIGLRNRRTDSLHLGSAQEFPYSGLWRVDHIRAQNTKKSHGGNRGFFFLG
jgi:hypothetical protein